MDTDVKILQFKTNLKCEGCVANIKPLLDEERGIKEWRVDLSDKDKVLTVLLEGAEPDLVIDKVQKAGYTAEKIIS